jgi:hypothetical protein
LAGRQLPRIEIDAPARRRPCFSSPLKEPDAGSKLDLVVRLTEHNPSPFRVVFGQREADMTATTIAPGTIMPGATIATIATAGATITAGGAIIGVTAARVA